MLQIFYVSAIVVASICHVPVAVGCYAYPPENKIYIADNLSKLDTESVFYHEMGHAIYKNDFKGFKDREKMANGFVWFMKKDSKNPMENLYQYILNKEQKEFFETTCKKECINYVKSLRKWKTY